MAVITELGYMTYLKHCSYSVMIECCTRCEKEFKHIVPFMEIALRIDSSFLAQ